MAAFWLAAIPSGVWATRTIGNTINESLFSRSRVEPPNLHLDHEGALAGAEAALHIYTVSPTASHLRELVRQSAERLVKLVEETEARISKHSWSRIFRDPDFSRENQATATEIDMLKSRVSLFLNVVQMFPLELNAVSFEKTLPENHDSIDSDAEEEEAAGGFSSTTSSDSSKQSATDSLNSSTEDIQPLETSFWQTMLAKAGSIDLSPGLASPHDPGN